jgi:HTH-type transcriptional regulator / antitoxin HipB
MGGPARSLLPERECLERSSSFFYGCSRAVIVSCTLPPIRYNVTVREAGAAGLRYTPEQIGKLIRETRKNLGVTQKDLALTSGTGIRFIIDLEKGKDTCEIGRALRVLNTLGIKITLTPPPTPAKED